MPDMRIVQRFQVTFSADEFRLLLKSLRGEELSREEEEAARELQEDLAVLRAKQSDQHAQETAKTVANISRAKGGV